MIKYGDIHGNSVIVLDIPSGLTMEHEPFIDDRTDHDLATLRMVICPVHKNYHRVYASIMHIHVYHIHKFNTYQFFLL